MATFCPSCGAHTPKPLSSVDGARVDYYRCRDCAHIWAVSKEADKSITNVTPLPAKRAPVHSH